MAIDPRTGERVYATIKQWILSGDLKLRERLDIDTLAQRLGASATPVRQALAILAAERLVTAHASRGYYVAFWSERDLKALYEWRWQLSQLAAQSFTSSPSATGEKDQLLALMRRLEVNGNLELRRACSAADDRLAPARAVEPELFPDRDVEIAGLERALDSQDRRALQNRLRAYFRRRIDQAGAIRARASIRALPKNGD